MRDGSLLVPVLSDHALWSPKVERFAEAMSSAAEKDSKAAKIRILFTGTVSTRMRAEFEALGLIVAERAAEQRGASAADEGGGE